MARPLRIQYPGAHYHVINRGNQRSTVFHKKEHSELFIEKLGEFSKRYEVIVHCYCCMPNHFHLYLQTRHANLSRFMQALLTSFTVTMNRKRRRSGHIFQGRFKAQLVEDELYRSKLSRYIHLNPIRTKSMSHQGLEKRRDYLRDFSGSTFPIYIGVKRTPDWINTEAVLSHWGKTRRQQMKNYRHYVEEGLLRDLESPFEDIREQSILGSDSFMDWAKREFLLKRNADKREQPALNHLQRSFSLDEIGNLVATIFRVDAKEIFRRKSPSRTARRVSMYCACKYCSYDQSLTDMAKRFFVSVSGLTRARDRVGADLIENKKLRKVLDKIELAISNGPIKNQ